MSGPPRIVHSHGENPSTSESANWQEQVEYDLGRLIEIIESMPKEIEAQVAAGVASGIRQAVEDVAITEKFWQSGYDKLTKKGADAAAQWAGRRVIAWAAGICISAGIYLAIKGGYLK